MDRIKVSGAASALLLVLSAGTCVAIEPADGAKRMGEGAVDAVTSPGQIVEGIQEDTAEHGAVVGTVTGTAKGTVKAAGQAVKGGAKVGIGAVETGAGIVEKALSPLTGEE